MLNFFLSFLLGNVCINSGRTLFRTLLKKSIKQVLIPKFIFIGDMLDDSPLHQSISIYHSFTTVRSKANFNEPVHQVTATEGPGRSLCTTPVCQRNDSPMCSVNLVCVSLEGKSRTFYAITLFLKCNNYLLTTKKDFSICNCENLEFSPKV